MFEHECLQRDYSNLKLIFSHKRSNSSGLQVADLVARPIIKSVMNPNQLNRAYNIIKEKLFDDISITQITKSPN